MRAWVWYALWAVMGGAVGAGILDQYVARGARTYLHLVAEHELGHEPEPSLAGTMAFARRTGYQAAGWLGGSVTLAGWATVYARRRPGRGRARR